MASRLRPVIWLRACAVFPLLRSQSNGFAPAHLSFPSFDSCRDRTENANLVTKIGESYVAAHSGVASDDFWESFADESMAASSSASQFPSFDDWLIEFSKDFLVNLTQVARDAIPADIAHLLPSPPALPPSVSAALSSETNSQVAASAAQGFREALASSTLARDPHSQSLPPTGCLSASYILAIKKREEELADVRSLSPAGVVHFLSSNMSPSSPEAAEFRTSQRAPFMLPSFDPTSTAYPFPPAASHVPLDPQHLLRLLPLLNSKGMQPLLTNGLLSQTIQHGFPEALAAALLRAIYRSVLPVSDYTVLLQDLSLVEKCCAFLRGEFEYVNIIAILTKVASITSSAFFGPGDASKPLASLEGTLPFALDQSTAVFVCRAFDLFLLFITGKDRVFSEFFQVHGRFALSTLVGTANKHLFATDLGPSTFVRYSTVVRGILQTLQQRSRQGLGDHSQFNIADLVGLDFFASSFLEDAKINYESNERFFADGSLFRLIKSSMAPMLVLNAASGVQPSPLPPDSELAPQLGGNSPDMETRRESRRERKRHKDKELHAAVSFEQDGCSSAGSASESDDGRASRSRDKVSGRVLDGTIEVSSASVKEMTLSQFRRHQWNKIKKVAVASNLMFLGDAKGRRLPNHAASDVPKACILSCAGPSILTDVRTGCTKRHLLFSTCPTSPAEASPLVVQLLNTACVYKFSDEPALLPTVDPPPAPVAPPQQQPAQPQPPAHTGPPLPIGPPATGIAALQAAAYLAEREPSQQACRDFNRGFCTRGANCIYAHRIEPELQRLFQGRPGDRQQQRPPHWQPYQQQQQQQQAGQQQQQQQQAGQGQTGQQHANQQQPGQHQPGQQHTGGSPWQRQPHAARQQANPPALPGQAQPGTPAASQSLNLGVRGQPGR